MGDEIQPPPAHDPGLRRLLLWTFVALVLALVIAGIAVTLVFRFWGHT